MLTFKPTNPALRIAQILQHDLQGYWPFAEGSGDTVADISYNAGDGTLAGPTWGVGLMGNGLTFVGASKQNIATRNFPSATFAGVGFSIAAWVNKASTGAQCIFGQVNSGVTDATLYFRINSNSGYYNGTTFQEITIADISLNVWHHVVLVYAAGASPTLTYYLDGVSTVGPTAKTGAPHTLTNTAKIGSLGDFTTSNYWDGSMDQVAIWNRVLTRDEIAFLYAFPYALIRPGSKIFTLSAPSIHLGKHRLPKIPPREPSPLYQW